jgi:hypothetical protein
VSGSARASERGASLDLAYNNRLSECGRRIQLFVDAGLAYTRMSGDWNSRLFASVRAETLLDQGLTVGVATVVSSASDRLGGFADSTISDKSLQVSAYARYQLSPLLRTGVFAGLGRTWYDFALSESDGFELGGSMTGNRRVIGLMLSGDVELGDVTLTTDAIVSHAVEKMGFARLHASFLGEEREGLAFQVGSVDVTRISLPVTAPITLRGSEGDMGGTWWRVLLSPGLLCEDNDIASSALRCGYQMGAKFVANDDSGLHRFYADYNYENAAGFTRSLVGVGYAYRLGNKRSMELALEANQGVSRFAGDETRAMLSIRIAH